MVETFSLCSQELIDSVSLYIHVPFCSRKCPYCHFYVVLDRQDLKDTFIWALKKEWELKRDLLKDKRIVSVYFGGGTPTKLPPSIYYSLLEQMRQDALFDKGCEITLEANPEDVTYEKMAAYRQSGINRLSLGVQSLQEEELRLLNRQHTAKEAIQAIHTCYQAGFSSLSIDLLFELPQQTLSSWQGTLAYLRDLPINHLSLYNLTIEPHTSFYKKKRELENAIVADEQKLAMLNEALSYLTEIGFRRYEISAFCRENTASRHNTGYWLGRPFLGFGPSAFSYWERKRFSNHNHLNRYCQTLQMGKCTIGFEEKLAYPQNVQELFAVQLRLSEGVCLATFTQRHAPLPQETLLTLSHLITKGWIEKKGQNHYQLTETGKLFYDTVASEIIT